MTEAKHGMAEAVCFEGIFQGLLLEMEVRKTWPS